MKLLEQHQSSYLFATGQFLVLPKSLIKSVWKTYPKYHTIKWTVSLAQMASVEIYSIILSVCGTQAHRVGQICWNIRSVDSIRTIFNPSSQNSWKIMRNCYQFEIHFCLLHTEANINHFFQRIQCIFLNFSISNYFSFFHTNAFDVTIFFFYSYEWYECFFVM